MKTAVELVAEMSADLGLTPSRLDKIIKTAPLRYKRFSIPKRSGGWRQVAQPAREVKAIQRWLISKLETILPIHEAATGYRRGFSIAKNAAVHASSNFLLKMDFENFFPSIKFEDLEAHVLASAPGHFDDSARALIARACTWAPERTPPLRLCVGAPSSPFLSNSVMYSFDAAIAARAREDGVNYTRYADDLTFSCAERDVLQDYPSHVRRIARELEYPLLRVNREKTVHASRAGRRVVTGLVLEPTGSVSVGRDRKRQIRAMFHRFKLGQLTADEEARLAGLVSFVESVEPGFTNRLMR